MSLSPTDQSRLGAYIRQCETDRRVSEARLQAIGECRMSEPALGPSAGFVFSVLGALVLGYALGMSGAK